jgi:hypothetical protein
MGFFRDFETELKIFFVLVALTIFVGWFSALGSLFSFAPLEESKQEVQETAPVATEEEKPAEAVETGPKFYLSKALGVSFEYPRAWFVYDETTQMQDSPCDENAAIENTLILSRQDLGKCVGVENFASWPGDLLISFTDEEWKNFPFVLGEDQVGLIDVGNASTARYFFNEHSLVPRKQAVRLYTNARSRGYIIEFAQESPGGTYDPVFDEILASLQWLQ